MKKFKFSLEKVLSYKEHMLDAEKMTLQRLVARRGELITQARELEERALLYRGQYEKQCRAGLTAGRMSAMRTGLTELRLRQEQKAREIKSMDAEVDRQIEKVTRMSAEKVSIEKLKERHLARYRYAEDKDMERFIEDFVQNKRYTELAG